MAQYDNILVGSPVEQQSGFCQQGIEPSAGLVHCLRDKLGRELFFKNILILKGIVMLRKGHSS